ncbi:hypothetical protein MHYP_G00041970 [Metynnis hypsauchen]
MFQSPKLRLFLPFLACLSHVLCFASHPTNVSVSCHNFENVVYWNYSDLSQKPEFAVTIGVYKGEQPPVLKTTESYLDISNYTDEADNVYDVYVEAWLNGSESARSREVVKFTYSQDFPKSSLFSKCVVDFPDVDVSASHHTIELSFVHPYDFYDSESLNDNLSYRVTCNETECGNAECSIDEYVDKSLCTDEMHIPEDLYGRCFSIHLEAYINSIPIKTSKEVCSLSTPSKHDVTLITSLVCIGVGILLIFLAAGAVMYKKVTQPESQSAIINKVLRMVKTDPSVMDPERPTVSEIRSISHTPLLVTSDDVISISTSPSPPAEITHFPVQPITDVELLEDQEPGGGEEDDDFNGFSDSFSGYDCQKFPLEMSPGDTVEAYRP